MTNNSSTYTPYSLIVIGLAFLVAAMMAVMGTNALSHTTGGSVGLNGFGAKMGQLILHHNPYSHEEHDADHHKQKAEKDPKSDDHHSPRHHSDGGSPTATSSNNSAQSGATSDEQAQGGQATFTSTSTKKSGGSSGRTSRRARSTNKSHGH